MKADDLSGRVYGSLTVVCVAERRHGRLRFWQCRCTCGRVKDVRHDHLTGQKIVSCGCVKASLLLASSTKHGGATRDRKHSEYDIWRGIIRRCHNQDTASYKYYGARGIFVCEEWLASFETFLADVGPRPSPAFSLERKDNDGPYSKENCVWATRQEQANNKRNNVWITIRGKTKTLAQWKRVIGIEDVSVTGKSMKKIVAFFEAADLPNE